MNSTLRDKLIAEIAKAIFDVRDDEFDTDEWEDLDSTDRERYECDARAVLPVVERRVTEAKAEALNAVADFLDGRGILWHGDSGVTVMGQPYSGQLGVRLTDWLRAQAVASESNVSEILTRSEQETL